MDLHSGSPFALLSTGLGPAYPALRGDVRSDVVVVGGGITGALCAFIFMEAGMDVIVLDGRSFGTGSTCASTSLLQYEIDIPMRELVRMIGEDGAARSYLRCAEAVERLVAVAEKIGFKELDQRPSIQFASKRSHVADLKKEHAMRNKHGLRTELFQGYEEVATVLPVRSHAALRSAPAAVTNAFAFTHALHAHNAMRGVRAYEHSTVKEFDDGSEGVTLITANGSKVRSNHLVYAMGYETREMLPKNVIGLHSTFATVSGPIEAGSPTWPEEALIWETARPYLYMRTTPDRRVLVGGRDVPFRNPAARDALMGRKTAQLVMDVDRVMPHLNFRSEFSWCGTFGVTKDGLPYIDRSPKERHSYYALGMGGNGITFSLVAAEIICGHMLGRTDADAHLFRFDR